MSPNHTARLLMTCPDRPGIVAAVTTFLYHHGANVTELDQHTGPDDGHPEAGAGTGSGPERFFMRLEFQTAFLFHLEHLFQLSGQPLTTHWLMWLNSKQEKPS